MQYAFGPFFLFRLALRGHGGILPYFRSFFLRSSLRQQQRQYKLSSMCPFLHQFNNRADTTFAFAIGFDEAMRSHV